MIDAPGEDEEDEEQEQVEFLGKAPKKKDGRITFMRKFNFPPSVLTI